MDNPFPLPDDFSEGASIDYHTEDIDFDLTNPEAYTSWVEHIIETHHWQLQQLTYIFCSDDYLHQLNVAHLQHDTLTDIITFPYAEPPVIYGDLFISFDRVRDNAAQLNVPFEQELRRVMIHGVLHLGGYGDKTEEEKTNMRRLEEEAMTQWG